MPRRLKIALLLVGTVVGYGSSIAHACGRAHDRRARFEHHVAAICADAAKNPDRAPPPRSFESFEW